MRKSRAFIALAALLVASPLGAQDTPGPRVGTLIVAEGAGPKTNAEVRAIAAEAKTGGPIEVSFLTGMEATTTRFQDVARKLAEQGVDRIIVVPLLISSHSDRFEQLRYLVGEVESLSAAQLEVLKVSGIEPADVPVPLMLTSAIDHSPEMAQVLAERALARADKPEEQALFLLGEGPLSVAEHAEWMGHLRKVAQSVKKISGFRNVQVGVLPKSGTAEVYAFRGEGVRRIKDIMWLQYALTDRSVVVVPIRVSNENSMPRDFNMTPPITYVREGVLHPDLARFVETRVREGMNSDWGVRETDVPGHRH